MGARALHAAYRSPLSRLLRRATAEWLPRPGHGSFRTPHGARAKEARHPRPLLRARPRPARSLRPREAADRRAGTVRPDPRVRILKGPLALEVARFGAPIAVGMGLQTLFNLVDAYLIGHLEPEVS